jgi:hypothetical protein
MSESDAAIAELKASMDRLNTSLQALGQSVDPHSPTGAHLIHAIDRLTLVLSAVGRKMDALTDRQFRELLDRPVVGDGQRNVPRPSADDEDMS